MQASSWALSRSNSSVTLSAMVLPLGEVGPRHVSTRVLMDCGSPAYYKLTVHLALRHRSWCVLDWQRERGLSPCRWPASAKCGWAPRVAPGDRGSATGRACSDREDRPRLSHSGNARSPAALYGFHTEQGSWQLWREQ